ncbi:MAG: class I SAM-dependent methyltransferase [Candidatus Kapaibacteriota bacterium]
MKRKAPYDTKFYEERIDSLKSAKQIVPYLIELFNPQSVVDVGCGTGEFLSVFFEYGITNIKGIDGEWVKGQKLRIPEDKFIVMDLENPTFLTDRFDLVISLEVAEHLQYTAANNFIKFLSSLGNLIVFSAAIPFQGGLHHINEQWPDFWFKQFSDCGYYPIDCFRSNFWDNDEVAFWYSQNMFLFVKDGILEPHHKVFQYKSDKLPIRIVHPKLYQKKVEELSKFQKLIPKSILNGYSYFKRIIKK